MPVHRLRLSHVFSFFSSAAAAIAAITTAPAAAVAPAAANAAAAAAAALTPPPAAAASADLLRGLRSRDCDNMLRVFKLQLQWVYDGDVLAVRVQVHVPRVQGRVLPGGALPFTTFAITTAPVARSPAAALAGQRLPVGRQPYTKSPEKCWRLQRRNRLRLELDGAHHRRRG